MECNCGNKLVWAEGVSYNESGDYEYKGWFCEKCNEVYPPEDADEAMKFDNANNR